MTAKLIFRNEASLEENFEFSYFKHHIQNEMGQGEVGVITFSEKSIPVFGVHTLGSCDLTRKVKVCAFRNEGWGRFLHLKNAILAFSSFGVASLSLLTNQISSLLSRILGGLTSCAWNGFGSPNLLLVSFLPTELDRREH